MYCTNVDNFTLQLKASWRQPGLNFDNQTSPILRHLDEIEEDMQLNSGVSTIALLPCRIGCG